MATSVQKKKKWLKCHITNRFLFLILEPCSRGPRVDLFNHSWNLRLSPGGPYRSPRHFGADSDKEGVWLVVAGFDSPQLSLSICHPSCIITATEGTRSYTLLYIFYRYRSFHNCSHSPFHIVLDFAGRSLRKTTGTRTIPFCARYL